MKEPFVYIEREPLLIMLAASVEVYNKECLGYLLGYASKAQDSYSVTGALNLAAIVRRTNTEITQSQAGCGRMSDLFSAARKLYPCIGDFHSHPSFGSLRPSLELSDKDLKNMGNDNDYRVGIVIAITRRGKKRAQWQLTQKQTCLRGALGKFEFRLAAYRPLRDAQGEPIKDERGIPTAERLFLMVAHSTLQSLNRAKS